MYNNNLYSKNKILYAITLCVLILYNVRDKSFELSDLKLIAEGISEFLLLFPFVAGLLIVDYTKPEKVKRNVLNSEKFDI